MNIMSSPIRPMDLDDDNCHQYRPLSDIHQTPTLFRIVHNPFDPPTSAHLKQRLASPSIFRVLSQNDDNDKTSTLPSVFDWSIEQLAELHPKKFSDENLVQIDAALFDENLMQRYQRAAHEFCASKLHLPTPAAPNNQQEKALSIDGYGYYCAPSSIHPMTSPFPHFDIKSTTSMFSRDPQNRPPVNFDMCLMEQCSDVQNTSLDTSFNITNQSTQVSRLSNDGGQNNVSFLKRRLFEDEEDDVNLLPEDNEHYEEETHIVTSTQRPKFPPRCDSETEDDYRMSSPSRELEKQPSISPILTSSFPFDADCSPIKKDE